MFVSTNKRTRPVRHMTTKKPANSSPPHYQGFSIAPTQPTPWANWPQGFVSVGPQGLSTTKPQGSGFQQRTQRKPWSRWPGGLGQLRRALVGNRGRLGCACDPRRLGDSGDDFSINIPGATVTDISSELTPPVSSGVIPVLSTTYNPVGTTPGSSSSGSIFSALPSSGVIPVLNNPASSPLTSGVLTTTAASAASPLAGISSTTLLLIGGGVLLLAVAMSKKR